MLSIPHLIVIFVVALVVFGPEKLPDLARNLGKVMGEFRRATGDLRTTFEGHLRDLERETEQRRIGPSTPDTAVPPPPDAFVSAAGTIPATPPHEMAASAAEDEFPSPGPASHDASIPATEPSADMNPASEHNSETLSDGNNRPA